MSLLESEVLSLRLSGLWREATLPAGIDFSSNDYLGLSRSEAVRSKLQKFLETTRSLGSTGSRLISGESESIRETEGMIARLFHAESALLFGSGYLANIGVLTALGHDEAAFFSDELNHASLIDGMRLAKGRIQVFLHNDLTDLRAQLKANGSRRKIVVTESVFSMGGDSPDLGALIKLCEELGALLVLDEAHATGVCGSRGLGLLADVPHDPARVLAVHTCGKALGGYGAFVVSSAAVRDFLINKARSLIFSTALPPMLVAQIRISLSELAERPDLRHRLTSNIDYCESVFKKNALAAPGSHIRYLNVPGNERALAMAQYLNANGYHVRAIRSPTVPAGKEGLRLTLKSFHAENEIDRLALLLSEAMS